MPINDSFKGGLDLKFFPDAQFESLDNIDSNQQAGIIARNNLRLLMMGWTDSWTQLITWDTLLSVFIEQDPELLKELRAAFQAGFKHLYDQLNGVTLNKEQIEQFQLYLSNCLSHLPYAELTSFESITIPQYINNQWEFVEYYVNPIELTEKNKLTDKKQDQVFAYGLEPIINRNATPHLIFMGTTFPAGKGFTSQLVSNFEACETIGSSLYMSGRNRIHSWLSRQKQKVHVCGGSLGGSLSLLLAIDLGEYVSRVDALNPAGLFHQELKGNHDRWDEMIVKPQVVIQEQEDDPLSLLGVWKADWEILHVSPPQEKRGPNFIFDHFMNYAGFANTVFTYMDPTHQNAERKARNLWLYSIGRSAVYYLLILPYASVVRPIWYFVVESQSASLILLSALLGVGALAAMTALGVISPMLFFASVEGLGIFAGLLFIPALINAMAPNELGIDSDEFDFYVKTHHRMAVRNPGMDIYNKEHKIDVSITYRELYAYYNAMRCLVKHKDLIPEDEFKLLEGTDKSKKPFLMALKNADDEQTVITLKTTKAKAMHIRHALTFIELLGFENKKELKKALKEDYQEYLVGKAHSR
ncbi:hypothetical protein [uncultured Legionella sp.]|uniref:hypothetical protein n=1 Tax=uncultured Legionella sp. TaxID=210934 RepID=UPI002632DFD8|nr:hypothetical protein [uncultured Legionella sp.]